MQQQIPHGSFNKKIRQIQHLTLITTPTRLGTTTTHRHEYMHERYNIQPNNQTTPKSTHPKQQQTIGTILPNSHKTPNTHHAKQKEDSKGSKPQQTGSNSRLQEIYQLIQRNFQNIPMFNKGKTNRCQHVTD